MVYCFGEHIGWVRPIERRLDFISIEQSRAGRQLDAQFGFLATRPRAGNRPVVRRLLSPGQGGYRS